MPGLPLRLPMPDEGRDDDDDEHVDDDSDRLAYDSFGGGQRGGSALLFVWPLSTTPRPSIDFFLVGPSSC